MVQGSIFYFAGGLGQVGAVKDATREFRSEQDLVGLFMAERCVVGEGKKVAKDLLYRDWREWCEENGEFEALRRSKKWLTRQMVKKGFEHGGHSNSELWGIGLLR